MCDDKKPKELEFNGHSGSNEKGILYLSVNINFPGPRSKELALKIFKEKFDAWIKKF